jgi:hypothetical protein
MRTSSTPALTRLATLAAAFALAGSAHAGLLGGGGGAGAGGLMSGGAGGLGVGGALQGGVGGSVNGSLERPAIVDKARERTQDTLGKTRETAQAAGAKAQGASEATVAGTRDAAARAAAEGQGSATSANTTGTLQGNVQKDKGLGTSASGTGSASGSASAQAGRHNVQGGAAVNGSVQGDAAVSR